MKTKVITSVCPARFQHQVNELTAEGWEIIPDTLQVGVSSTSNAWRAEAQTARVFGVVLKKED